MSSHPSDTCHHCRSIARVSPLRHTLACLIRLAARRLSTPPHLSLRGQDCRQITSLAFHLCHAGMLTLWQLAAVFSRRKKKHKVYTGQVENPTIADSVRDTRQWYWWLQWGCMEQRSHTKGPACVCLCMAAKAAGMQIKSRCFQRAKTWRSHIMQNSFCQYRPTITCLRLANQQAESVLYFFYSFRLSEIVW